MITPIIYSYVGGTNQDFSNFESGRIGPLSNRIKLNQLEIQKSNHESNRLKNATNPIELTIYILSKSLKYYIYFDKK